MDYKSRGGPFMPTQAKQQIQSISGFEPYVETAGEEYMGKPMREHFTKILNKWKQDLMQEVDRTVDHMKDEAANFPDPADRASQEEEFSLELRARDRERKLIKKIDKTLQLIEDEEYGWCESCGVEIGIRRLEARPTADMCVDCKTLAEIKEKQVGK
ncbi:RNA polymerase-binding protein DksA [Pseudomonas sp. Os17]|uniref:RNA polymerase-binding transcription factor DksA n=9 Tax=Pseudomonas TaxID=286 RepID=A0A2C9ETI9_PSEPH|nr:DnaK suppressor protein DksA [Pseudomonas protegens CHA0]BAQ76931.1 RNA polymerase-binding protein DksA [Pseudomonas sp. Os17]BAQ83122.1 RNA polymerase-binding protein DksA [Pseudomonas sp. St29]BCT35484.1 RNA polymerase-binding transcription factor DksA [Pseudomonas protegens]BFD44414.1 RNA polymerase-binding protein DksA [Pseudomonas sp. FFPRI_1]